MKWIFEPGIGRLRLSAVFAAAAGVCAIGIATGLTGACTLAVAAIGAFLVLGAELCIFDKYLRRHNPRGRSQYGYPLG